MYIEHPYKYDGKYYANVDGKGTTSRQIVEKFNR